MTSASADEADTEETVMVRTAHRAVVLCAALAAAGAGLAAPAQAASTDSAMTTVSSDVTALTMTCRSSSDFSPWTYISGSCKRSALYPKEFYSAWLTCVDVRINREYSRYGTQYLAPWGFYGSTSTARCDSGDHAIAGGIS